MRWTTSKAVGPDRSVPQTNQSESESESDYRACAWADVAPWWGTFSAVVDGYMQMVLTEPANRFRKDFLFGLCRTAVWSLALVIADFRLFQWLSGFVTEFLEECMVVWGSAKWIYYDLQIFASFQFAQASCLREADWSGFCSRPTVWETASWITQPRTELVHSLLNKLNRLTQIGKKLTSDIHNAIPRRESLSYRKYSGFWVPALSSGQLYITIGIFSNSSSILFGCMHSARSCMWNPR